MGNMGMFKTQWLFFKEVNGTVVEKGLQFCYTC